MSAKRKSGEDKRWKWGIMSAGRIANDFVLALQHEMSVSSCEVVAVGARKVEDAQTFAKKFNIANAYGSYKEVAEDKNVEVVYVGTIHPTHYECVKLAITNYKHVLCEKPLVMNAQQARELVQLARKHNVYFQEAMWTRTFPLMGKVRELIKSGAIGDVISVTADFGFRDRGIARLTQPDLGGGALLDIGVYVIALGSMVLGPKAPNSIKSSAHVDQNHIDLGSSMLLSYGDRNQQIAVLHCTIEAETSKSATIFGSKGTLQIHKPFWCPNKLTLKQVGQPDQDFDFPYPHLMPGVTTLFTNSVGFVYQALHVVENLNKGLTESPTMTQDESIVIMEIMDEVRRQNGIKYPGEK